MCTKQLVRCQARHVTVYACRDWLDGGNRMQITANGDFKMVDAMFLGSIVSGLSGFISKFIIICEE